MKLLVLVEDRFAALSPAQVEVVAPAQAGDEFLHHLWMGAGEARQVAEGSIVEGLDRGAVGVRDGDVASAVDRVLHPLLHGHEMGRAHVAVVVDMGRNPDHLQLLVGRLSEGARIEVGEAPIPLRTIRISRRQMPWLSR